MNYIKTHPVNNVFLDSHALKRILWWVMEIFRSEDFRWVYLRPVDEPRVRMSDFVKRGMATGLLLLKLIAVLRVRLLRFPPPPFDRNRRFITFSQKPAPEPIISQLYPSNPLTPSFFKTHFNAKLFYRCAMHLWCLEISKLRITLPSTTYKLFKHRRQICANWGRMTEPPSGQDFTVNFKQLFVQLITQISQLMVYSPPPPLYNQQ